ncbi:MAG: ribosome small subunit-dependent GTPase A [Alistipes sp.]|jgi:ribosome biogenesis GTPase|nr:ribosome small subunit-dependent GTPase A [Alistipes sp.]
MRERFTAVVMRSTGSWYEVRNTEAATDDEQIQKARVRGRLRLSGSRSTNPVVVGDRVQCSAEESGEVWIEEVLPRDNYIIRRSSNLSRESHIVAANIDRAVVVATLFSPVTAPEFIDRFLVTCEAYRIPATVILNKIDLALATDGGDEAVRRFVEIYEQAGYGVMLTSAVTGRGVDELRDHLRGRTTLVSGNSGVGKSTLIGAVSPGLDIRVGEISRAHGKGMHTTTFSQMYPLGGAAPKSREEGYIIDTPGIKGFGLVDIEGGELYHYFPDLMRVAPECQYYNCTHTHEPGCAVTRAVESGQIAEERYTSYLKMLEEDNKYR